MPAHNHFQRRLATSAFAFRGYNIANLGRTHELLAHARYGEIVAPVLDEASQVAAAVLGRPVDLATRVRRHQETHDLTTYAEDLALIIAVEVAQMRLLEQCFGITLRQAKLAFGYSLGEASALIAAGVYEMRHLLRAPVTFADDLVALGQDVTLGVLFSRRRTLDEPAVKRLCLQLSQEGRGTIAMSAQLSPNAVLLVGQQDTLARFQAAMRDVFPAPTYLRKNPHRWPPMHTPITWQRAIPNRGALLLETLPGGLTAPPIPILSGNSDHAVYDDCNSRELLHRWIDHPQRLWSLIYRTLAAGIDTVIHVGPAPNLVPATFRRLSEDVRGQINGYSPASLGLRAVSHLVRRPWLAQVLPSGTAVLRAPFVQHIILEDWLLEEGRGVAASV
jgi:[acyl-carrier-protein] S-malonyltransferase